MPIDSQEYIKILSDPDFIGLFDIIIRKTGQLKEEDITKRFSI